MRDPDEVLAGFHAVAACLRSHPGSVREILVDATRRDARLRELLGQAQGLGVRVSTVDEKRLDALAGGGRHQGVVALTRAARRVLELEDILDAAGEPPFLLLLDGVTDPHNLGACLRTADALGVHAVVVPKDRSAGMSPVVAKVASGAAQSVPLIAVTNLVRAMEQLKEAGVWLYGADEHGAQSLLDLRLRGAAAWVLGAEGQGLRRLTRERCDLLVRIPMLGRVESLNVSVAAALCLYETRRQRSGEQGGSARP